MTDQTPTKKPSPATKKQRSPRLVPKRKIPRQGTSSTAYVAELSDEDEPLLNFKPYLHKKPRRNSITPDLQRRFIATLAATGIVTQAARSIGKSMEALYKLRVLPGAEDFADAWDGAIQLGINRLEDCAMQRAINGVPTPIVSGGKLLGTWDKPDNNLLRFLLQYRMAAQYSPAKHELKPGHPVYDAMEKAMRNEIAEFKRKVSQETTAHAIALQTFRRRRFHRIRDERDPGGPLPPDAWDGSDENGYPQLPAWSTPHVKRAKEILEEMERNPPF